MSAQVPPPDDRIAPPGHEHAALADEALMVRYASGDARAADVLLTRHQPALLRAIRRRVATDEDAQDLLQHSLLNLHRARESFDARGRLRPWLYAIAMNAVREHHRRARRRRELPLDEGDARATLADPARPVDDLIVAQSVRAAMGSLLDSQREVIELRWFEGRDYDEIAEHVGASQAAVRVRAHRGYERLRGALAAQA